MEKLLFVLLVYAVINWIVAMFEAAGGFQFHFKIKIPPKDGMIESKEPLYKIEWFEGFNSRYIICKYVKNWEIFYRDWPDYSLIDVIKIIIPIGLIPFFIKFYTYKYRTLDMDWAGVSIPKLSDESDKESLLRFNKDIGEFYEQKQLEWKMENESDNEKRKRENSKVNDKLNELNEDFNKHYIT